MDFAEAMRALMDERGLGVRALSRRVHCDAGLISKISRGKAQPSAQMRRLLDDALSAGGQLRSAPAPRRQPKAVTCDDAGTVTVPCRTPDGRIVFVTVPRRVFLQQAGAAAVAVAAAPALPAVEAGKASERFALARRALMDLDNTSGPRAVIPLAQHHVAAMRQIGRSLAGADRRDLMDVQIQFADLIGWLYQDCGDYQRAAHWLDRALEWAHANGDRGSVGFILARKSQLAGDECDAENAAALAGAAIRSAGQQSRIGAVGAVYGSYAHALAGGRAACERLRDQARSALEASDDDSGPWARFLDHSYLETGHARSLAVLGDYQAAAGLFRAAIGQLQPGYYRDRGVYLAREARAWAGAGELDLAAMLGTEALSVGTGTASGRIFAELASLEHALAPASTQPAVRDFRDAMNAAVLRPV